MNNLSNSFTDDELRGMITGDNPQSNAYRELLALREAQRKVAAYRYRYNGRHLASVGCAEMVTAWKYCDEVELINPDERYEHQPLYAAPQLPAVPDDTRRMDWLCSMVVDVREPLVYGSHSIFWSQCDSADDEPHHTTLREQIDAAIAAAPKPE